MGDVCAVEKIATRFGSRGCVVLLLGAKWVCGMQSLLCVRHETSSDNVILRFLLGPAHQILLPSSVSSTTKCWYVRSLKRYMTPLGEGLMSDWRITALPPHSIPCSCADSDPSRKRYVSRTRFTWWYGCV